MTRPRVAVSTCLLGEPVRFNGGHSRSRFLTGPLAPYVDWVPICPEVELGLGTPRETLRLETSPSGPRLMTRASRNDLTEAMSALAGERAATLDADGYVFKAKSPTCGIHGIPLYPPQGPPIDRRNRGLFAESIIRAHPLLAVEDEGRLNDALLREAFVERIFAHARLRELLDGDWRPRDLVAFHARHKMQILAHDPDLYRRAGRIVADAGTLARTELAAAYAQTFRQALSKRASLGRNVNVLQHCLGMLDLDPVRRDDLLTLVESYRVGLVPLSVPATLLRHHAHGQNAAYVREQSYLSPYPDALRLRHHLPPDPPIAASPVRHRADPSCSSPTSG
ncbi:YbgA family protein [Nonomuraea sp. NPDC050790]|uniref:YbgA family protein n=1 Tax=Nonomuraea sp. NPDC050790 TaxID=3364371 RepID=UPI00379F51CB